MQKFRQFCQSFTHTVITGALIVLQAAVLLIAILRFSHYFVWIYGLFILISVCAALWILNNKDNPSYKLAWIIPILLLPLFGGLLYLFFGTHKVSAYTKNQLQGIALRKEGQLIQDTAITEKLQKLSPDAARQAEYIYHQAGGPVYQNTQVTYLSPGEKKFECMLEELEKAEHYIFLEYFILEQGKMWDTILEVLVRKAKQGVDVRVIFDDFGSLLTLPPHYEYHLRKLGLKAMVFNPFRPILSIRVNNRDHRKICIIDGHTAFTGGINLADEYINAIVKHGHWKDASIRLKGEAVWSFTMMFLSMWGELTRTFEDYEPFRPHVYHPAPFYGEGFVAPFDDSPLDDEAVGESVYMNIINRAQKYVYIMTPYLIIDNEMVTALSLAAKSGVDVRILTPHLGDKWFVHTTTRAHYSILIENGVKIYEYTPGFVHAKIFVSDDEIAVVGSVNLDFRSLYLHYECGAWMYGTPCVQEIYEDYMKTLEVSQQITPQDIKSTKWYIKLAQSLLRIFAPLM